jgi:hypothetical protein
MIIHGIHAAAMYSTRDLRLLGIGDIELMRARKAGVKPRKVGKQHWYLGAEVVQWMASQDRSANDRDEAAVASAGTESGAGGPIFSESCEAAGNA